MVNKKTFLFWQPKNDWLFFFEAKAYREKILVILNYLIWLFFFYLSYLLIRSDTNIFWQILFATVIAEFFERLLKSKVYWQRPLFKRKDRLPHGLVSNWYQTGSFPSGHTIKAVYFLLFILQYQVFPLPIFLLIVSPLLIFRVLVGFHYPIDILGGIISGFLVWFPSSFINFPDNINKIVKLIFNFIFRI